METRKAIAMELFIQSLPRYHQETFRKLLCYEPIVNAVLTHAVISGMGPVETLSHMVVELAQAKEGAVNLAKRLLETQPVPPIIKLPE